MLVEHFEGSRFVCYLVSEIFHHVHFDGASLAADDGTASREARRTHANAGLTLLRRLAARGPEEVLLLVCILCYFLLFNMIYKSSFIYSRQRVAGGRPLRRDIIQGNMRLLLGSSLPRIVQLWEVVVLVSCLICVARLPQLVRLLPLVDGLEVHAVRLGLLGRGVLIRAFIVYSATCRLLGRHARQDFVACSGVYDRQ